MKILKLDKGWKLKKRIQFGQITVPELEEIQRDDQEWYDIDKFPAQVHDVLLENGVIDSPWLPGKAEEYQWIAKQDWVYKLKFNGEKSKSITYLHFKGLDTIVDIYLNDSLIASHKDLFIPLKVDVTDQIEEHNTLIIHFHSVYQYMETTQAPDSWEDSIAKVCLFRKMKQDFGDYLGPKPYYTRVGMFRDVFLETIVDNEIFDFDVKPTLNTDYTKGKVVVKLVGTSQSKNTRIDIKIYDDEALCRHSTDEIVFDESNKFVFEKKLKIANPDLWWPRGYGKQSLYKIRIQIISQNETISLEKNIGFREINMPELLKFSVNGRHIKLWGADVAPIDFVSMCWNNQRVNTLLDMAENANMNVLRVWGENGPFEDQFYDEADKRGFLVWQDFFTSDTLPEEEEYLQLYVKEAAYHVKRLKHHPCILLWCGGNEQLMWHEMNKTQDRYIGLKTLQAMGEVCKKYDPDRFYMISSPYYGNFPNDPAEGNTHGYTNIWFVPGYDYLNFATEDTRIAAPALKSVKRFFKKEDIWPNEFCSAYSYGNTRPWPESWANYTSAQGENKVGPVEQFYDAHDGESLIYRIDRKSVV